MRTSVITYRQPHPHPHSHPHLLTQNTHTHTHTHVQILNELSLKSVVLLRNLKEIVFVKAKSTKSKLRCLLP